METTYLAIEQLDLSARQLLPNTPSFDRFSLILSDNIIELMLYEKCREAFLHDKGWHSYGNWWGGEGRYSPAFQADILGQHFERRPKFCRTLGVISEEELEFILILHSYRNEVYHVGIRHNDVLHALAWQYHEFACDLFARICPIYRIWRVGEKLSDAVKTHLPGGPESASTEEAAVSLKGLKPSLPAPFSELISSAILERVEEFAGWLWYIADEDEGKEERALRDAQFHVHMYGKSSQYTDELSKIQDVAEYTAFVSKVREEWRPEYTKNPTHRFETRAKALRSESNPLIAVKKFQKLCDDLEPIANVIGEVATIKDNYEQMEMDIRRGK